MEEDKSKKKMMMYGKNRRYERMSETKRQEERNGRKIKRKEEKEIKKWHKNKMVMKIR